MTPTAAQILKQTWKIAMPHRHTSCGINSVRRLTRCMDTYFNQRFQELGCADYLPFSLIAVGGYGRRELCLRSDIDILMIYEDDRACEMANNFFTPLWDQGFILGHGVMITSQCLDLARTDKTFLTSLLDARFVVGSRQLSENLLERIDTLLSKRRRDDLSLWLIDGYMTRHKKHEGTGGMLEPNIKEGIGGLRDCNLIHWLAILNFKVHGVENLTMHGLLDQHEKETLTASLAHIFLIRNSIHALAKRATNRLHFEIQPQLAQTLGYEDQNNELAVERFLVSLHRCLAEIRILCRFFIKTHITISPRNSSSAEKTFQRVSTLSEQKESIDISRNDLMSVPQHLMDIFVRSCITQRPLSWKSRHLVSDLLYLVDDAFRQNQHTADALATILMAPGAYCTLTQMLETGFLGALIPEFGRVQDRVQFDAYHLFPVGAHSLRTLQNICTCTQDDAQNFFPHLCRFSKDKSVRMAALLHDIGKTGPNHAARSGTLTDTVLKRFGWPEKERKKVIFLVANHLLLVHTALRRDLNEESVIQDLAFFLQTPTRLHKLTLLTWADSKATGPKAWSTWTRTLLQELVLKTQKIIDQEVIAVPLAVQRIAATRDFLRTTANHLFQGSKLESLLKAIPSRYLLHVSRKEILTHLTFIKTFMETKDDTQNAYILTHTPPEAGEIFTRLTLITTDRAGLFATITGTLALHDIHVLTASLHRWHNDLVVDTFTVMGPPDPLYQDEAWQKIETTLNESLANPDGLDEKLAIKQRFHPVPAHPHCLEPECVRIDNGGSDFYSIVEMRCKDHPGLLHTIAKGLYHAEIDVAFAKIATHKDQVQDTLYVRNKYGQKITTHEEMARVRQILLHSIG